MKSDQPTAPHSRPFSSRRSTPAGVSPDKACLRDPTGSPGFGSRNIYPCQYGFSPGVYAETVLRLHSDYGSTNQHWLHCGSHSPASSPTFGGSPSARPRPDYPGFGRIVPWLHRNVEDAGGDSQEAFGGDPRGVEEGLQMRSRPLCYVHEGGVGKGAADVNGEVVSS